MPDSMNEQPLQRLIDKEAVREVICRYARGVDRGDWNLVRSAYHPDAHDAHGDYKGGIDGFIEWLDRRFDRVDNSMHFLGNSLIEFARPDVALVETYFVSRRLVPITAEDASASSNDVIAREAWGRYVDRFEWGNDEWRIAQSCSRRCRAASRAAASVLKGGAGGNATAPIDCTKSSWKFSALASLRSPRRSPVAILEDRGSY